MESGSEIRPKCCSASARSERQRRRQGQSPCTSTAVGLISKKASTRAAIQATISAAVAREALLASGRVRAEPLPKQGGATDGRTSEVAQFWASRRVAAAADEPPSGPFLLAGGASVKVTAVALSLEEFPSCEYFLSFSLNSQSWSAPFCQGVFRKSFCAVFRLCVLAEESTPSSAF